MYFQKFVESVGGVHNHNIGAALQMLLKVTLHGTIRKDDF